jgi:hypothetical protein
MHGEWLFRSVHYHRPAVGLLTLPSRPRESGDFAAEAELSHSMQLTAASRIAVARGNVGFVRLRGGACLGDSGFDLSRGSRPRQQSSNYEADDQCHGCESKNGRFNHWLPPALYWKCRTRN